MNPRDVDSNGKQMRYDEVHDKGGKYNRYNICLKGPEEKLSNQGFRINHSTPGAASRSFVVRLKLIVGDPDALE